MPKAETVAYPRSLTRARWMALVTFSSVVASPVQSDSTDNFVSPCVPVDDSWSPARPEGTNGDDFCMEVSLGFSFNFYGKSYDSVFINSNGLVSFKRDWQHAFSSPTDFPITRKKLIAPFWADVDTRGEGGGSVSYKQISNNKFAVTWQDVGYYQKCTDKHNTFQVVLSDGSDDTLGPGGKNLCFCYDNMEWTTGDNSHGENGFGGEGAIVGINKGDGVESVQIGRFNQTGDYYDGPFGKHDCLGFLSQMGCGTKPPISMNAASGEYNSPPIPVDFPENGVKFTDCDDVLNFSVSFLSPEDGQVTQVEVNDTSDVQGLGLEITKNNGKVAVIGFFWNISAYVGSAYVGGNYTLEIIAKDNFEPQGTTEIILTIVVKCAQPPQLIASGFPQNGVVDIKNCYGEFTHEVSFHSEDSNRNVAVSMGDSNGAQDKGMDAFNDPPNTWTIRWSNIDHTDNGLYPLVFNATDDGTPPITTEETLSLNVTCIEPPDFTGIPKNGMMGIFSCPGLFNHTISITAPEPNQGVLVIVDGLDDIVNKGLNVTVTQGTTENPAVVNFHGHIDQTFIGQYNLTILAIVMEDTTQRLTCWKQLLLDFSCNQPPNATGFPDSGIIDIVVCDAEKPFRHTFSFFSPEHDQNVSLEVDDLNNAKSKGLEIEIDPTYANDEVKATFLWNVEHSFNGLYEFQFTANDTYLPMPLTTVKTVSLNVSCNIPPFPIGFPDDDETIKIDCEDTFLKAVGFLAPENHQSLKCTCYAENDATEKGLRINEWNHTNAAITTLIWEKPPYYATGDSNKYHIFFHAEDDSYFHPEVTAKTLVLEVVCNTPNTRRE